MTDIARALLPSLAGGLLIGLSAAMLLLLNGRIAGISGLVAGLGRDRGERRLTDLAFVLGLLSGPPLFAVATGAWPVMRIEASWPLLAVAGLLVGFGSRLGSGCTSGHGVAGLARLSPRSLVAVATFLASGMATVTLMRLVA
ncbi:YeeE/YedE family protein [Methylobacterium sp. Leaf466]|uniref:YeeE/YedE family protein n=1 Tax=Methylobacterium sp. Leaf466 TaxID=1736386 RepID=UPI000A6E5D43